MNLQLQKLQKISRNSSSEVFNFSFFYFFEVDFYASFVLQYQPTNKVAFYFEFSLGDLSYFHKRK